MHIGILQADSVREEFQPKHGDYPGMIEGILNRAADELDVGVDFTTYNVEAGIYPDQIDECDGYVITGSKKSVYDDEQWIRDLGKYVQDLHEARVKLVGLCFGHQIIAEYLGGKTLGAEVGWGVGIHHSEVVQPAWFMEPGLENYSLIVSHKDQVVKMPEGAELLATSEFCPNSMFTIGEHILAMQGHPEFDREYSLELINFREETLGPQTVAAGRASLECPLSRDEVSQWIIRFIQGKSKIL